MSTARIVQLICSVVLILLPAAIQYRNWIHSDTSTKPYHRFTLLLLCIWVCSASGMGWVMYQDWAQKPKGPTLKFFLNGFGVTNGMTLTFPVTNLTHALRIAVLNDGDWPADGLLTTLQLPNPLSVSPSGAWKQGKAVHPEVGLEPGKDSVLFIETPFVLPNDSFLECDPLSVQLSNCVPSMNEIYLTVAAKNYAKERTVVHIHYETGADKPRIGF